MKIGLRLLTGEEMAAEDEWRERFDLEYAWHLWKVASCEERGGHWWWLEIDPDDGVYLSCRYCPADVNDIYPDGIDLLAGQFEVYPGYVLTLRCGGVEVNGEWRAGLFAYGWRGAVTARLHIEEYRNYFEPPEYDVYIDLEAA